jgi:hypothetical protein
MTLPNFLIVGAMKAGTTSLRGYLRQHEEIYLARREVHFFDREHNYRRGMSWYERQFASDQRHRAVGEKTPAYCFFPRVPERIHRHLPGVKLIWLLRDPVARAHSHYWHLLRKGEERAGFEAILKQGLQEEQAGGPVPEYLGKGRYAEQIERYLRLFPRERMLFLLFEDFIRNPKPSLRAIFEFIGVTPDVTIDTQRRRNTGALPRSVSLSWYSKKLFGDSWPHQLIRKLNRSPRTGYPPMSEETRELLCQYYRPHNRELANLLGSELKAWETDTPGSPR